MYIRDGLQVDDDDAYAEEPRVRCTPPRLAGLYLRVARSDAHPLHEDRARVPRGAWLAPAERCRACLSYTLDAADSVVCESSRRVRHL